jgi:GAF domain-containing protein
MAPIPGLDAARLFVNVAQDLMTQPDLAATHERIVSMAVKLTGCTSAAILTVRPPAGPAVGASTDPQLAAQLGRIAAGTTDGPAVQAQLLGRGLNCPSMDSERRWPEYARRVLSETAIRSEAAYPLRAEGCDFGVLSMYSVEDGYFRDEVCSVAEIFTGHALMAMLLANERNKAANLEIGLLSNREIGMAIGVLMTRHRSTEQQAFDMLRMTSQHDHRKLREVAADVVLTGQLPALTPRRSDQRSAVVA